MDPNGRHTRVRRVAEAILIAGIALTLVSCARENIDHWNSYDPNANPNATEQSGGTITVTTVEEKTLDYNGRFHAQALFVLDNSGSMVDKLAPYINAAFQAFIASLSATPGLSFQLAFTDTNYDIDGGKLLKSTTGLDIIQQDSPATAFTDIFSVFSASVNLTGTSNERGLPVTAAALKRDGARLFSMPPQGAALSRRVVIITDANDTDFTTPVPVKNYTDVIQTVPNLLLYPIVELPTVKCANPTAESFGQRYVDAVAITGGEANSICAQDFATSLQRVFKWIQNVCITLDKAVESEADLKVYEDGVQVTTYSLDAAKKSICFDLPNQPVSLKVEATHTETIPAP